MRLNIKGIDKVQLLKRMWENMQPASFFRLNVMSPPPWDQKHAAEAVANGYIDYFQGRSIKTDLSKDTIDCRSYDIDAGYGTLESIVSELRVSTEETEMHENV